MPIDQPELERLDYNQPKNNSPNENIIIVDNILSWSTLINDGLEALRKIAKTDGQKYAVKEAVEQIGIFQKVDLPKLREAFE